MRLLSFLFFLAFVFFAIFARWFFVCDILQQCEEEEVVEEVVDERAKTLALVQNDSVIVSGYDEFAFEPKSYEARLNDDNNAFLDTLAHIMKADSNLNLSITGFYTEAEMDVMAGFFENMGLARADFVRKHLLDRDIAENRISIDHGISLDTLLASPLKFALNDAAIPSEYATTAYTFTNMTFSDANFEVDSYQFTPGEAFISYADSLKTYLSLHADKQLEIIGHTDSDGSDKYNDKLGLNRAKSAREYFEALGVENEIVVSSAGKKEPVVPNNSTKNKQKNRRVNFVIE